MTSEPSDESQPASALDRLHGALSRVTSSGRFIAEIDGLRFVAIGTVLLFHIQLYFKKKHPDLYLENGWEGEWNWLVQLLVHGDKGVELFFTISGFILALPFAEHYLNGRKKIPLGKYFYRRLTRLEPPYFINLMLAFTLLVLVNGESFTDLVGRLLLSFVYLHNLVYGDRPAVNGVAWSLEIEVQFYILAPFLAMVFAIPGRWARRALIVVVGAGFGWMQHTLSLNEDSRLALSLPAFIQHFLVGFLLADVYLTEWKSKPEHQWSFDLLATFGFFAMPVVLHYDVVPELTFPVLTFCAYYGVFRGVAWNALLTNRWIAAIGGMCYSIYLYHFLMISFIGRFTARRLDTGDDVLNMLVQIAIAPVVLASSALLFVLFEKPFMYRDWPSKWAARLRGQSSDSSTK